MASNRSSYSHHAQRRNGPIGGIVKIYGEAGFDAIAITDHLFDSQSPRSRELREEGKSVIDVNAYFHAIGEVARWAKETYDLLVIPGLEICNLPEDYHILGIDLKEPINPNQGAEGVIEEIHRQGGLAIASHPHLKLSYFLQGDNTSIQRHPLHIWKHRKRYSEKLDAWEIANREDLFPMIGLERLPFVASSDFHEPRHLTSWKSLIFAEKQKDSVKESILQKKISLFFFNNGGAIEIPAQVNTSSDEGNGPNETAGKGSTKILIVDDERDLVEMLSYNLKKKGYRTLAAYSGYEAWGKIESERPDLLILDLMMPDLDGWELCRMVRRNDHDLIRGMSILMLTARALEEDRVYGLEIGADDYLTKPFSLSELILRVEKLAEKKRTVCRVREEMECLHSSIEKREMDLKRVIHDLKNPLLSMGASAKRMLRRNQGEEEVKALRNIYDSSARLTRWIDDTFFSGHISEKIEEGVNEVEIESIVRQAVELLKDAANEKKIEIRFETSPAVHHLYCHEQLISRAIENLLTNALKYTPAGGKIDVTITSYMPLKNGGIVEISVKDTGIGILGEDLERIFEPFYRGTECFSGDRCRLGIIFGKRSSGSTRGESVRPKQTPKGQYFFHPVARWGWTKGKGGAKRINQNVRKM